MECFWRKVSKKENIPLLHIVAPLLVFGKEGPVMGNEQTGESSDIVLFSFIMECELLFVLIRDATKHF